MGIDVLIPSSLFSETNDQKIRTYKAGMVARCLAIFRCNNIFIYDDRMDNSKQISILLKYAATPPYLRKILFDKRSELRHAGVMPPLRISSHAITKNDIYREGVVKKTDEDVVWVECGLDRLVAIRTNEDKEITEGDRISLEVKRNPLRASVVDDPPGYWGYTVESGSILEWIDGFNGTIIGTSRKGEKVGVDLMLDDICIDNIGLVFGSPERGIQKILDDYYGYNIKEMDFDYVLNTIPRQGSETVRTEEALLATLSLFNILKK